MSRCAWLVGALLPLLLLWCSAPGGAGGAPQFPLNMRLSDLFSQSAGDGGSELSPGALDHLEHQISALTALGNILGLNISDPGSALGL